MFPSFAQKPLIFSILGLPTPSITLLYVFMSQKGQLPSRSPFFAWRHSRSPSKKRLPAVIKRVKQDGKKKSS